jgi:hypothetical protein
VLARAFDDEMFHGGECSIFWGGRTPLWKIDNG